MANKYSANEFKPNAAQIANGQGHSWYAKEEIDQIVKNQQIAERLAARTGFKPYEIKAIIEGLAEVSMECILQSQKVQLCYEDGSTWMLLRPECKGSITDKQILAKTTAQHAEDPSVEIRSEATEKDLLPSMLKWTVAVTIGDKFSTQFKNKKEVTKVAAGSGKAPKVEDAEPSNGGNNGGGSNSEENVIG